MYSTELAMVGVDPFSEMRRLQREVNRLFAGSGSDVAAFPAVNIWTNQEEVVVKAEIPGVDPKDLDIRVQNDVLTLQGERKPDEVSRDVVCHRCERDAGKFTRSFRLPFDVQNDKVTAKYNRGALTITLPRSEAGKPRKIAISDN